MSRLDGHIRRLRAQRTTIAHAEKLIADLPGPILELGLGNGRTFDHLRERFSAREVFAFDLVLQSHPASRPDAQHFIQGDFLVTLPKAMARIGQPAALAHCDFGSHDREESHALAASVAPLLAPLLTPGAIILSDQPMIFSGWQQLPLPRGIRQGRYFINRAGERPE